MSFVTAPTSPSTIDAMNAAALKMVAYNTKLANECVLYDIFAALSGEVIPDPNGSMLPEAILVRVKKNVGAHTMKMGLLMDLQNAPQLGNAVNILGNEENLRLKHITLYHNEIKKGVASFGWGVDYNALEPYQVYSRIHPKMVRFLAELRGRRCREALLLTIAEELTEAPRSLSQQFNPNIFVLNTALESMPSWDVSALTPTAGTYPSSDTFAGDFVERIADVLMASVNSGANPEYANLKTVEQLLALEFYVRNTLKIEPIMIDGQPSYIFVIPANAVKLRNATESNSLAEVIKEMAGTSAPLKNIPNVIGRYGSLVFVTDERYPTLTVGGSDGAWTLTPGFMNPGNNDGRNNSAWSNSSTAGLNYVFNVGMILGKAALWEWIIQDFRYATESTEYGKFNGKGAYGLCGMGIMKYDEDTETDAITGAADTYYQRSSCMVLMSAPDIVTTSS